MIEPAGMTTAIARAPLRISLAGGGTDLPSYAGVHEGSVVSIAINRFVTVTVQSGHFFGGVRAALEQAESVPTVHDLGNPFARAALLRAGVSRNVELASLADVPSGTGLGGSGAFTVALLNALRALRGVPHDNLEDLAETAALVEIEDLERPVGKQDHYASALGGAQRMSFGVCGSVTSTRFSSPGLPAFVEDRLHLYYTGRSRDAGRVLMAQASETRSGNRRTVTALHAIKELVSPMERALRDCDAEAVGHLLDQHWQHKKRLSDRVTTDGIDEAYAFACDNGALGGKLVGAGGGGFLLLVSAPGRAEELDEAMHGRGLTRLSFALNLTGTESMAFGSAREPA